jgi:hypothetical protein
VLKKLSARNLMGKVNIEAYLREKCRRRLRPTTINNSFLAIDSFIPSSKSKARYILRRPHCRILKDG